ncbi:hypothetical protein CDAR_409751 [Caerostris darwini]|uniref:Uncharacterized protein n=1 Tax=Caerostris darwini TaxID=1538125 RepID=A0AAV4VKR4_9ARAC|nr:hypothetical protein CDAR_409751 [Caerostris darwini]
MRLLAASSNFLMDVDKMGVKVSVSRPGGLRLPSVSDFARWEQKKSDRELLLGSEKDLYIELVRDLRNTCLV